jgi:Fic family protein
MWNIDLTYRETFTATFNRLYEKRAILIQKRPLPPSVLFKIKEALSIEWTYNSNSIEGNTLTLRETQLVLQEGITIKGKSLKEHLEIKNHEKAIHYLFDLVNEKEPLLSSDLLSLHQIVMNLIEEEFAGRFRTGGVRIIGANFIPPNASKVSNMMEDLFEFVNSNPLQLNAIELATVFHHKMVWIHPFNDGNGRTVRLAMNLLLMKEKFPPAIILKTDRKKYYEALNQANMGNYHKLIMLMCQAVERSLNIYLNALPGNDYDYKDLSNIVSEGSAIYSSKYLSALARNGKIDAHKEGRYWFTCQKAIANYIQNKSSKKRIQ